MQPDLPLEGAEPTTPAPEELPTHLLVFRVGAIWYGVAALKVKSVVGATTAVRIPGTPAFVAGVASVSGRIAIVLELDLLLGRDRGDRVTFADRLVMFDAGNSVVAVLADEVAGVASIIPSRMTPLASDETSPTVQTFLDAERMVTVVDVTRMIELAESRIRQRGES